MLWIYKSVMSQTNPPASKPFDLEKKINKHIWFVRLRKRIKFAFFNSIQFQYGADVKS